MNEQAALLYMFSFYGLFAMIAYEGSIFCVKHSIYTNLLSDTLERARHRVKLYEDNSMGITGLSSYVMDTLLPIHEAHMRKDLIFPGLTKHLQKDMSITYVNKVPVFTTLGASYETGVGEDAAQVFDGEFIKQNAAELSSELKILNGGTANVTRDISECLTVDPTSITTKDVFARNLYGGKFNGKDTPALNSSLYIMQCRQNFIETCLASCGKDETLLKYKYVSVYTALKGLQSLKSEAVQQKLTSHSVAAIDTILALPFVDKVLSANGRHFRNAMVHNDIRGGFTERRIMPNEKFYGLVEYFFNGMNSDALADKIDKLSSALAQRLNAWS